MLVAVLEERNKILADNIRQACTAAAANWEGGSRSSASGKKFGPDGLEPQRCPRTGHVNVCV